MWLNGLMDTSVIFYLMFTVFQKNWYNKLISITLITINSQGIFKSFTGTFCEKFAIKLSLKTSRHTQPCEI